MSGWRPILLVGLGGFVGSIGRYLLAGWVHRLVPFSSFPFGTLAVNVSGCLAIGLLGGLADSRNLFDPGLRLLLLIGLLGGFTTFSSLAYETLGLLRDGESLRALANVGFHVVLGLAAAWAGYTFVRG